ncbi:MAG: tRNA (cytidine(34)-2'-O)-methyltransferase [Planctomycetota bacterium]|jgi:tRNA (cytidine/uridine-2'-O-)-methyltransferase
MPIVLVHPEIPHNTGAIGRLCVATGTPLHLIQPLGFSLEDRYLRRAGMDYWEHLERTVHKNWEAFLESTGGAPLLFFTTKTERSYWEADYPEGAYLVFGSESRGLPDPLYEAYRDHLYTLPMNGEFCRSLNLANAASIALYEALRQNQNEYPISNKEHPKGG